MFSTTTQSSLLHETRFGAMGTDVHVVVVGGDDCLLEVARNRILELESRWSRFVETSELSILNHNAGTPSIVSDDTFELIRNSIHGWMASNGRFDPSVCDAMIANGYDRDFKDLADWVHRRGSRPSPGMGGIEIVPGVHGVTLPRDTRIDAGGIGKGLAADKTVELLTEYGAEGAMVNIGGDLRVQGRAVNPAGWVITVPDPIEPNREMVRLAIDDGAVATSSRLLRRWQTTAGEAHHLIDPSTGDPIVTDVASVTVVAARAWWAEVLTKSAFIEGPGFLRHLADAHAVMVMADGTRICSPGAEVILR